MRGNMFGMCVSNVGSGVWLERCDISSNLVHGLAANAAGRLTAYRCEVLNLLALLVQKYKY